MSIRAQQKLQTRQALLESARLLMNSGRGFGSLSLREVSRQAGIVPAGFYRHFADMEAFGLALVAEVGDTFRAALRQVRHHELQQRGMIEASVEIFLRAVGDNRDQFLFLAREQYGGSLAVRQAIADLRQRITQDLARDLLALGRLPHLTPSQIDVLADLVVKTVFATLPELIDTPPAATPCHLWPAAKMVQQLKLILIGSKHWRRTERTDAPKEGIGLLASAMAHQIGAT